MWPDPNFNDLPFLQTATYLAAVGHMRCMPQQLLLLDQVRTVTSLALLITRVPCAWTTQTRSAVFILSSNWCIHACLMQSLFDESGRSY